MAGGVLAGARMPYQPLMTKPGTASATVGTLGSKGERWSPVKARALSLPDCTWGSEVEMLSNISETSPPSNATTAGPLPL
ncbi:Uncharacterised protein [Achromobacter xylosoxidans]|nr:Uncharacterised protein [Achromobacter xylosoxidans]